MATMRAGLLFGAQDLRLVDIPIPEPGPGQVLMKIHACSICPTDVRKYRLGDKDHGIKKLPFNLGHEWAGEVVKLGPNVQGVNIGDRMLGGGFVGYAQYAVVPGPGEGSLAFAPKLPDNVPYEVASMTEPFADCIHSLRDQGKVTLGDRVVIVGAGPMALMHVMVAKAMGAYIIVSEPDPVRRDWAKKFGADMLIDPTKEDWPKKVKEITGGGADCIILSIGTPSLVNEALQATANGARVVLFGGTPTDAPMTEIEQNLIHYHEVSLIGCEWIGIVGPMDPRTYRLALRLMSTGQAPLEKLITHRYSLEDLAEAFKVAQSREGLKVILFPWGLPEK